MQILLSSSINGSQITVFNEDHKTYFKINNRVKFVYYSITTNFANSTPLFNTKVLIIYSRIF